MTLYNDKKADYFSTTRTGILDLIPEFSQRVLEIGCGAGQTLALLKENKRCAETVGIELFPEAADAARNKVDLVYCLDAEKETMPQGIGKFDLILLLDVLEHLFDPWSVLARLTKEHLAVGGRVIVSLPNARHFSLVVPLLFGKFDYTERGIIDKTHLRFFTRDSAAQLLHGAGLTIEATKRTSLDLYLNSGKVNAITLGLFSEFLTSQYIFRAVSRG